MRLRRTPIPRMKSPLPHFHSGCRLLQLLFFRDILKSFKSTMNQNYPRSWVKRGKSSMGSTEVMFLPSVESFTESMKQKRRSYHRRSVHGQRAHQFDLAPVFILNLWLPFVPLPVIPLCWHSGPLTASLKVGTFLLGDGGTGWGYWGYWIWQAVEGAAWQHMQVGFTALGGIRSRSSSSGISSSR